MDAVNKYTYIVQKTKGGKVVLITTEPQKVTPLLAPGNRVEVWEKDHRIDTIYTRTRERLEQYKPKKSPTLILDQNKIISAGIQALKSCRKELTSQQYKTLKGQMLSGDVDGALKGLQRIRRRAGDNTTR